MKPFFSLIIPIYNAEAFLRKCLNSILNQNFFSFEVICVNDGSNDTSQNICLDYVRKDNRIKLYNQHNQGVSAARNMGIDHAEGEYIVFIDSDDWIDHDFLDNLHTHLIISNPDILFYGFYEDMPSLVNPVLFDEISGFYQNPGEGIYQLEKIRRFGYAWCKVFKTSIIKEYDLYFEDLISFREDEIFTLDYCIHVSNLLIIAGAKYHYRCGNPDSLINKIRSYDELQYSADILCDKSYEIARRFASPLLYALIRRELDIPYHMDAVLAIYNKIFRKNKNDRLTALRLYYTTYKNDLFLPGLKMKHRVLILVLNIGGPRLADKLLYWYYLYLKNNKI